MSGAATIGGTPSDVVSSMAGHWRCTSSTGSVSHRSYVVTDGGPVTSGVTGSSTTRVAGGIRSSVNTPATGGAAVAIARTVYGRQDSVDTGASFERIVEMSDHSLSVQAHEGAASAGRTEASAIHFAVTAPSSADVSEEAATGGTRHSAQSMRAASSIAQPVTLSYSVEPNTLRRVSRIGSQMLSAESCTREAQTASSAACANANAPAAAVHAVQPSSTVEGAVAMRLVIDDRGRVVGEDVLSASSPALTQSAIFAARDSTFTAALANCRAVSSQLSFGVQFHPDAQRHASGNGRETNL